jgi:hypothetical protein
MKLSKLFKWVTVWTEKVPNRQQVVNIEQELQEKGWYRKESNSVVWDRVPEVVLTDPATSLAQDKAKHAARTPDTGLKQIVSDSMVEEQAASRKYRAIQAPPRPDYIAMQNTYETRRKAEQEWAYRLASNGQDVNYFTASALLLAAMQANQQNEATRTSVREEESFKAQGGNFAGAGATASWDTPISDRVDRCSSSSSDSSSSSSSDSGSSSSD